MRFSQAVKARARVVGRRRARGGGGRGRQLGTTAPHVRTYERSNLVVAHTVRYRPSRAEHLYHAGVSLSRSSKKRCDPIWRAAGTGLIWSNSAGKRRIDTRTGTDKYLDDVHVAEL